MQTQVKELIPFVESCNKRNREIEQRKSQLPFAEQLVFDISEVKMKIRGKK